MERVYTEKLPNRFCAAFVNFISVSTTNKVYTDQLVKSAFIDFFENLVTKYPDYNQYSFNCTGSIGFAFKEILSATAASFNMKIGVIIKAPIEGLAAYHLLELNKN